MKILIVEDDADAANYLKMSLVKTGHSADIAEDGEQGYELAEKGNYDVCIIDRMLPKSDGLSLIVRLKEQSNKTPILILSALGQVDDRVIGLRIGGDDYLTKPYAFSELLARVESLGRRAKEKDVETFYKVDDLELDRITHSVKRNGRKIILQPREFSLLEYFMQHVGQVVTRTMLLENIWNYHFDPQTNLIDVHIFRLRSKIEKDFEKPLLHTIRGVGYILKSYEDD